jgi:hypothetical protein
MKILHKLLSQKLSKKPAALMNSAFSFMVDILHKIFSQKLSNKPATLMRSFFSFGLFLIFALITFLLSRAVSSEQADNLPVVSIIILSDAPRWQTNGNTAVELRSWQDDTHTSNIVFTLPPKTTLIAITHLMMLGDSPECGFSGSETGPTDIPIDKRFFKQTESLGGDRAPYTSLDLVHFPQPTGRRHLIIGCVVNVVPQRIGLTRRSIKFENDDLHSMKQIPYLLGFEGFPEIDDFTFTVEDLSTRYSDRSETVENGGSVTARWSDVASEERRDEYLVLLGTFAAFASVFLIDVYQLLMDYRKI